MYKKFVLYLLAFLYAGNISPECAPSPFFSNKLTTHLYFGQDLNILAAKQFDPYSLFQYIFDSEVKLDELPIRETKQTISIKADARIKGIFGNKGSGIFPYKEFDAFQIWLREVLVRYCPTENKNNFLQAGYFPFIVGNGFVLGAVYRVNTPTTWQLVYEQVDQFRPGILAQVSNQKKSIFGQGYLGFIPIHNKSSLAPSLQSTVQSSLQNLGTSGIRGASNFIIAALQLNFGPTESHAFQISPYLFFQANNQNIELVDDATSKLYTPGFCGFYERGNLRTNFEAAHNFGHQEVKQLDRTFVPTNSYDRLRRAYKNTYAGYFLYLDFFLTKGNVHWGMATSYASGDNAPNDSYETILITKSTPGYHYKDYNKTYKGFIGTEHFSQARSINGLYFGVGALKYTNLAFVGSIIKYTVKKESDTFSAQATVVSYFKPTGLFLNIADQTRAPLSNNPLSHYLGTECNGEVSYILHTDITLSLLGGILFPGSFYTGLRQQARLLEQQVALLFPQNNPFPQTNATKTTMSPSFFMSFGVSWQFDSSDIKDFFRRC